MRRVIRAALMLLLCAGLSGCGQTYETEHSTVFIQKDGTIVSTDVESFDVNTYEEDGLRRYVEDAIAAYNRSGDELVHLEKLTVEEGRATLVLTYASAEHYAAFNRIGLYTGQVSNALAAGYSFDAEFADVSGGSPTACRVSDFIGSGYQVAIIGGTNIDVRVPGTIVYLSTKNTAFGDKNTVVIREGTHLLGSSAGNTEGRGTEDGSETETAGDSQTEDGDMPATDEDILSVEEDTEVFFEFGGDTPEESGDQTEDAADEEYTYIIYKIK